MTIYLVALTDENARESIKRRIAERWPDNHRVLDDRIVLLSLAGFHTPKSIASALGIGVGKANGLVVTFDARFADGALPVPDANWIRAAE